MSVCAAPLISINSHALTKNIGPAARSRGKLPMIVTSFLDHPS
jgi:hypothetical protein